MGEIERIYRERFIALGASGLLWFGGIVRKTSKVEVPELLHSHGLNVLDGLLFHGIVAALAWEALCNMRKDGKPAGHLIPSLIAFVALMSMGWSIESDQSLERGTPFDTSDMYAYAGGGTLSTALLAFIHRKRS